MGWDIFGNREKMKKLKKAAEDMPSHQGGKRPGNAKDQRYGAAYAYMAAAEREGWDLSLAEALKIVDGD